MLLHGCVLGVKGVKSVHFHSKIYFHKFDSENHLDIKPEKVCIHKTSLDKSYQCYLTKTISEGLMSRARTSVFITVFTLDWVIFPCLECPDWCQTVLFCGWYVDEIVRRVEKGQFCLKCVSRDDCDSAQWPSTLTILKIFNFTMLNSSDKYHIHF